MSDENVAAEIVATGISTILVGVDGSPEARQAAAFTAMLARQLGAEVVAVHAVSLLDVWPEHPEDHLERNSHTHVTALLEGPWIEPLTLAGVQPRLMLRDGPPSIVLLAIADEIDADLIVIGIRGAGQADLFALGSTTTRITERSTRPVVVVPP